MSTRRTLPMPSSWRGSRGIGERQARGLNQMLDAIRGPRQGNQQADLGQTDPDDVGTAGSDEASSSTATAEAGLGVANVLAFASVDIDVPIYDATDPETKIGTATYEAYTSITYLIPGIVFGASGIAVLEMRLPDPTVSGT